MKTYKPTFKTVDKWTESPEEIFRKHGLTLKWGNKTGSCIFLPAHNISLKDNYRNNETAISFEEFPTSIGTKD